MCGGTATFRIVSYVSPGLSPRVRGNLLLTIIFPQPIRSIPACAGEPRKDRPARRWKKVYPRVCGGTVEIPECLDNLRGLSPRVRGNRWAWPTRVVWSGSIPACAGEPVVHCVAPLRLRVYPRVCGGTVLGFTAPIAAQGLSPRVRGNPIAAWRPRLVVRSIPACAGEPTCAMLT